MKQLPAEFVLELFAGTARVTQAFRDVGIPAFPVDFCLHGAHNVLPKAVELKVIQLLKSQRVKFLWVGMPCTSFSHARKADGLDPGPLRDSDHLHGLPNLTARDQQKVDTGNRLLLFTMRMLRLCEKHKINYALENPMSSFAWSMPEMQRFCRYYQPVVAHLH